MPCRSSSVGSLEIQSLASLPVSLRNWWTTMKIPRRVNLDRQDMARVLDHQHMGDDLSANNFCAQQSQQMFLYLSVVGFEFSKLPILPIHYTQFCLGGHAKYINILKTSIDLRQIDGTGRYQNVPEHVRTSKTTVTYSYWCYLMILDRPTSWSWFSIFDFFQVCFSRIFS